MFICFFNPREVFIQQACYSFSLECYPPRSLYGCFLSFHWGLSSDVTSSVNLVQLLSRVRLVVTPWTAARQASLSFTISWSFLRLISIESVMLSNHLTSVIPFSSCPQSFPASGSFPVVSSLHPVARVLELQHQSFQWTFRTDFSQDGLVWSPCSPRDSQERVLSNITVQNL